MARNNGIAPMPFSTADWLRCPELKVLAPDVRGLWMDVLCYMWESPERGVMVKPNGEVYTKAEIVRLLGVDNSGTGAWLDALIDAQVCSVRGDGAIYSRRMVRDADISEKRRAAGKIGGQATKERHLTVPVVKEAPGEIFQTPTEPEKEPAKPRAAKQKKKIKYADNVSMTEDEYNTLLKDYTEEDVKGFIDLLDNYKGQNGKRYKSDYRAILNWVVNAYNERRNKRYGQTTYKPTGEDSGKPESERTFRDTL